MEMASTLRSAREQAGLTQAALARRAGTTQSVVARLERPGANPTIGTVERLLRAAGRTLSTERLAGDSVDESQIVERLRLAPAERLRLFSASQRNLARLTTKARRVER